MIYIKKYVPPSSLSEALKKNDLCYDDLSADIKDDIKRNLLMEQGYLCAYCMQRIGLSSDTQGEKTRHEQVTIEHYVPQSKSAPFLDTDYRNMLGVCSGSYKSISHANKHVLTCDKHKNNTSLTVNPQDESTIALIKYRSSGEIYSDNRDINNDLNVTLNLNCRDTYLVVNRQRIYVTLTEYLKRRGGKNREFLLKLKRKYESRNVQGMLEPFCGVALFFIDKWLSECE